MRTVLIISGLDPSGGAGFIADVRVAEMHGVRAVGVITALTEQDSSGVRAVHPAPAGVVGDQLRMVLGDVEVHAVKIGMLAGEDIALEVADALDLCGAAVVWDPLLRPTAGSVPLYRGDPLRCAEILGRHLGVITPNIPEAEVLLGRAIAASAPMSDAPDAVADAMLAAAGDLCRSLPHGPVAVMLKGGHLPGHLQGHRAGHGAGHQALDAVATGSGAALLQGDRLPLTQPIHGTGCALATALACNLAASGLGTRSPGGLAVDELAAMAKKAKEFVAQRMATPVRPGRGHPSLV